MKLKERYSRLSLWSKIGFWGSVASILGIVLLIIPNVAGVLTLRRELTQEGIISVDYDSFHDVYYYTPYRGLPQLTFPPTENAPTREAFEIVEQRPDGFRIEIHSWSNLETNGIRWKATGIKAR